MCATDTWPAVWDRVLFLPASMWLPLPATSCSHLTGSVSRLLGFCDDLLLHVFANNQTYYYRPAKTSGVKFLWLWTQLHGAILQQKSVAANYSPGCAARRTINSISCRPFPRRGNTRTETETPPMLDIAADLCQDQRESAAILKIKETMQQEAKRFETKDGFIQWSAPQTGLCICHHFS